jgi:hypothetical protein
MDWTQKPNTFKKFLNVYDLCHILVPRHQFDDVCSYVPIVGAGLSVVKITCNLVIGIFVVVLIAHNPNHQNSGRIQWDCSSED